MSEPHNSREGGDLAPGGPVLRALSRYSSTLLLLMVFCVEMGIGIAVIRDLRAANVEAQRMYAGSVRGLRLIGELQYDAQETRRSTLYALTTNDSNLQVEYADQSREADQRVTAGIHDILQQSRMPPEVELARRLQRDWSAYLAVRDEVLASILEGSTKEAVHFDLTGGVSSFDRVRQDLEGIKRLYDEQASERLANVDAASGRFLRRLIWVIGFTLAFASLSVWAIQRSKMLGALQQAKLQMDFVASVSHELRTPLSVISLASDNIADGVVGGREQLAAYGRAIRGQCRQITELVNQILLFASTRARQNRYVLRPLQVSEVVQLVLDNTQELVRQGGFAVEQNVESDLPWVMGDLSYLTQCLQNLVVNAVKYSGASQWIAIRAFVAESGNRAGKEVRIEVRDRGLGIAASEMTQIFEPFYRSPAATAAQVHGTGLGLPLAKSIAESMGGRLSVVSELGRGSVFTLHLPVIEERAQASAAAAVPAGVQQK